ncbi:ribosomal-protein-alanine N-acetyltransferase [Bacillus mesophilus]|uniref:GNAT family N-acetyltransferase n=1 Tax=Bacillus mesophilus TaxID=1808955 RepID=A0A6M0Q3R3_9BACI|nr:GNAT family protein [Bacillus mesophilus]MBM7660335.1 ribosomal-protein-alanine N-acetyltransferase [Bacillus mesophilus]NEY71046.1 GNAT family N-acetyltransferase [Bacillus mesophilus]
MKNLFNQFPILHSERLTLRPISEEDAEHIYEYFSDDEVTQFYGIDSFTSLEQAIQLVTQFQKGYEEKKAVRWGIALSDTNQLIGSIGFHNMNHHHKRVEIGYEITKLEWGKGFVTEALKAVISYAFDQTEIHRIGATVRGENIPSQQVLTKLGFAQEGVLRDYQFSRGVFYDLIMFSLVRHNGFKGLIN